MLLLLPQTTANSRGGIIVWCCLEDFWVGHGVMVVVGLPGACCLESCNVSQILDKNASFSHHND